MINLNNNYVELTPEQVHLINDMIHAWVEPEKKGEFRQAFRNDCKRLLATVPRAPAQTAMSAQDALEIAANIADSFTCGECDIDRKAGVAIREVAKKGYWVK